MKGIPAERELVRLLERYGIVAFRIPASGAARKKALPDVVAGYKGRIAFFEVKHGKRIYIPKRRLEELSELAEAFGAHAFIAFRPKGTSDYYIIPAEKSPSVIEADKAKFLGDHILAFIHEYFLGEKPFRED